MKCYLFIIAAFLLGVSCNKALDEKPESIAAEVFYNTPAEVEAGVNAIYDPIRSGSCMGAFYLLQMEIYSEYMYGRGSHASLNEYQGLDNTNMPRIQEMWTLFYKSIRNANIVIREAPLGNAISEADIEKYVSEACFLRALCYFHLVRNWGGVPLRTTENMDSINVARSPEAAVYKLIQEDLAYAAEHLPGVPRMVGAPSRWSARTLQADVYLTLRQYQQARDAAREVIQSGRFSLVNVTVAGDFEKIYGADVVTTPEEIFYLRYTREPAGQTFTLPTYTHYPNAGYYPLACYYTAYSDSTNPFIAGWDRNDLRYTYNWYPKDFDIRPTTILNRKYVDVDAVTGAGNDYPMYRYADVLLMYAEAENQVNNGPTAEAMEMLNRVHRRAYGKNPLVPDAAVDFQLADYSSVQAFQDLLVKERGYETVYEGKRWLELKRLGIAAAVIKAVKGRTIAVKHMLWPIPASEYNYNKAIDPVTDQNPGY